MGALYIGIGWVWFEKKVGLVKGFITKYLKGMV